MAPARTPKTNRVFIDSSVLIAAAISDTGAARDLLRQGFRGQLDLFIASQVLEETERNLSLKAPEALSDFHVFRQALAAKVVDPPEKLVSSAAELVVIKDAVIVAAAVHAKVTYLATYDRKHLLNCKEVIKAHLGLNVVTPDEVVAAARRR